MGETMEEALKTVAKKVAKVAIGYGVAGPHGAAAVAAAEAVNPIVDAFAMGVKVIEAEADAARSRRLARVMETVLEIRTQDPTGSIAEARKQAEEKIPKAWPDELKHAAKEAAKAAFETVKPKIVDTIVMAVEAAMTQPEANQVKRLARVMERVLELRRQDPTRSSAEARKQAEKGTEGMPMPGIPIP